MQKLFLPANRRDYTIPAPPYTTCGYCRKEVEAGSTEIVRFSGRIFHLNGCFTAWFPNRYPQHGMGLRKAVNRGSAVVGV